MALSVFQFDFDEWLNLAKTNPAEFEHLRQQALALYIGDGKDVSRLRSLQCRIDLERRRARTPFKACLALSTLMWDRFGDLNGLLNGTASATPVSDGRILPFRRSASAGGGGATENGRC